VGDEGGDEADGVVALEDPVGGGGEDKEDADSDLDSEDRGLEGRIDELLGAWQPFEAAVEPAEHLALYARLVLRVSDRGLDLFDGARDDRPEQEADEPDERAVVDEDAGAPRDAATAKCLDAGRIDAAIVNARKSSASRILSFQSARAPTTTSRTTIAATNARRAVSCMCPLWPC
jgi:hypothetical protein